MNVKRGSKHSCVTSPNGLLSRRFIDHIGMDCTDFIYVK